jgi:hypothetical protein
MCTAGSVVVGGITVICYNAGGVCDVYLVKNCVGHYFIPTKGIICTICFQFITINRTILGTVYDDEKENWRILTNKEIYAIVKKNLP